MEKSNIVPFDPSDEPRGNSKSPMKSSLVDQAAKIVPDPQVLVNIISQRVRQLNSGRSPLIDAMPSMGSADIALTEIIEGKIIVTAADSV